jgi:hypothetical protein
VLYLLLLSLLAFFHSRQLLGVFLYFGSFLFVGIAAFFDLFDGCDVRGLFGAFALSFDSLLEGIK